MIKYTMNPLILAYTLNQELILAKTPFSDEYISLSIAGEEEYASLLEFFKFLKEPKGLDEIYVKSKELGIPRVVVETLINQEIIIPCSKLTLVSTQCTRERSTLRDETIETIYYIYYGKFAEHLLRKLEINNIADINPIKVEELNLDRLEVNTLNSLILAVTDPRSPNLLKSINKYILNKGRSFSSLKFLPIYTLGMATIVGPLVTPFSACYVCSDTQITLAQQYNYLWGTLNDTDARIINMDSTYNTSLYYDFVSSFILLLLAPMLEGRICHLLNKVIVIDLEKMFIDSFNVYKMPLCECSKFRKSLEV